MMRTAHGLVILILTSVSLCPDGMPGTNEQGARPRRDYEVHDIGALDALIRLGQLYDRPLGIVSGDKKIATTQISIRAPQATAQEAMTVLIRQLPAYEWREDRGVIIVQPHVLPPLARKLLGTVISRVVAHDSSAEQLSALLWWELQRRLDPENAPQGYWGVSHDRVRIIHFNLTNASVQEVLNEIARRRGSAAWIALPPPETLKGAPRERLWSIVTYADPPEPLDRLCCLNREYFR